MRKNLFVSEKDIQNYKDVKVVVKITDRDHQYISDIVPTHVGKNHVNTFENAVWWSTNVKPNSEKITKILSVNKKIDIIIVDSKNKNYYYGEIIDIESGKNGKKILSPDVNITPEYYRKETFKTWYKLQSIVPIEKASIDLNNLVLRYRIDANNNRIPLLEKINSRPSFMYVIDKNLIK